MYNEKEQSVNGVMEHLGCVEAQYILLSKDLSKIETDSPVAERILRTKGGNVCTMRIHFQLSNRHIGAQTRDIRGNLENAQKLELNNTSSISTCVN